MDWGIVQVGGFIDQVIMGDDFIFVIVQGCEYDIQFFIGQVYFFGDFLE